MPVGTDIGNVYKGQQGTGFATVFREDERLKDSLAAMAAKKKSPDKFFKESEEKRPGDTWHFYNNELAKQVDGKIREGAALMTATGSANLWSDTSQPAFQWREDMARLNRVKSNIDQYKEQYDKAISAIAVREESYDQQYVKEVKSFPAAHSFEDLATGQVQFPTPKFTNPGDLYADFYTNDRKAFQESLKEGEIPSKQAVKQRLNLYFSDPSKQPNAQAAAQAYGNLTDEAKKKYQAIAETEGFDQPWMAHAYTNYLSGLTTQEVNLAESAIEIAKKAEPKIVTTIDERGDVTKYVSSRRLKDPKYPDIQAKSFFHEKAFLLDNPSAMAQLGVSMEIPREERRAKAEKAYAQMVRDNVREEFERRRLEDEAGVGASTEEIRANWDLWRKRIGSGDQQIANEAAGFVVGGKDPTGMGVVTNARISLAAAGILPFSKQSVEKGRIDEAPQELILEYSNVKAATAAREKYYKEVLIGIEKSDQETQEEFNRRKESFTDYLIDMERRWDGETEVRIPLIDDKEQILKRIHDDAVKRAKGLYEPQITRTEDELGILQQGPSTYDPAGLDE